MIKRFPGWANWIALWLVYAIAGFTFKFLMHRYDVAWEYVIVIAGIHSAIYLCKWRFDNGNWKFW